MLCGNAYDAHLATTPQRIPTQHDMLPQHLVCKYEMNFEYRNITLAKNKAPWWWSDKIETCRSVLKCFMWNYISIRWLIYWNDSTKMHGATIRFIVNAQQAKLNNIYKNTKLKLLKTNAKQSLITQHTTQVTVWQAEAQPATRIPSKPATPKLQHTSKQEHTTNVVIQ